MTDVRTCLTCHRWNNTLNSMAAHGCCFHPLPKNGPSGGRWHGPGVYDCCNTSDDPHHINFHSRVGRLGCCAKDCCPLDYIPFPTRVYEKDWPSALRESVYEDINRINTDKTNSKWKDMVKHLHFKGIRIDKQDKFYLARIDEEELEMRMKHKYNVYERLSKCIHVHVFVNGEKTSLREIIVENEKTVRDMLGGLVPGHTLDSVEGEDRTGIDLWTTCGSLSEDLHYEAKYRLQWKYKRGDTIQADRRFFKGTDLSNKQRIGKVQQTSSTFQGNTYNIKWNDQDTGLWYDKESVESELVGKKT